MRDSVHASFLAVQEQGAKKISASSDIVKVFGLPGHDGPPSRYIAQFLCQGVVRSSGGLIAPVFGEFIAGIAFHDDHLRRVHPLQVVTWLEPDNILHPNIASPHCCIGRVAPGVELVDILYQLYEMITFVNWAAHDALDPQAAEWARHNQHLFPLERRPLRRLAQHDGQPPRQAEGTSS